MDLCIFFSFFSPFFVFDVLEMSVSFFVFIIENAAWHPKKGAGIRDCLYVFALL